MIEHMTLPEYCAYLERKAALLQEYFIFSERAENVPANELTAYEINRFEQVRSALYGMNN